MIYGGETFLDLDKAIADSANLDKYTIDVEGGFGKIPPLEIVRALDRGISQDIETTERIARYCIIGRRVTVYYGGEAVGSPFVMNGMSDDWGAFDVFEESPLALQYLFSLCMAYMLKKSTPRQKSTRAAAAKA